ncbi:MAG: hypothetical protein WCF16_03750 [Alphaproteobacteria bacterium]
MGVFRTRYRLPVEYSTEIGRLITRWAFLEWRMRELTYLVLRLSPKEGRVAVRDPRATGQLTMLEDLLDLRSLKTSISLKAFHTPFEKLQELRDAIGHGIWMNHPGSKVPVLQWLKGSYPELPGGKSVKARIYPGSMRVSLNDLRLAINAIGQHIADLEKIRDEIEAQVSPG